MQIHRKDINVPAIRESTSCSITNFAVQKEGRKDNAYCSVPFRKKGAGRPKKISPVSFETAIPSTLFPDSATTIKAISIPRSEPMKEIAKLSSNEIFVNLNILSSAIDITKAIMVGIPSLENKYPFFPIGVTARYFEVPSSISPRITYAAAKQ